MGISIKVVTKKLIYLNRKTNKSEKEESEYKLMLKNKGFSHEDLSSIIASIGINETKKIFMGKFKLIDSENKEPFTFGMLLLVFLLILYVQKKEMK